MINKEIWENKLLTEEVFLAREQIKTMKAIRYFFYLMWWFLIILFVSFLLS